MLRPLITLMTDFGEGSPYVAQMKAALFDVARDAVVVDLTHSIAPQAVREGALIWSDAAPVFPRGTVHVGVVDPGVGTDRPLVAASIRGHAFVGPDNGLFDRLIGSRGGDVEQAVRLTDSRYWRKDVSHTFHGRDIMAPVAAHLARGTPLASLGQPVRLAPRLTWPKVAARGGVLHGEVVWIDRFGNLVTNIRETDLRRAFGAVGGAVVQLGNREIGPLRMTYAEVPPGTPLALLGSSGRLEVAVSQGDARRMLNATCGESVQVKSSTKSQPDS